MPRQAFPFTHGRNHAPANIFIHMCTLPFVYALHVLQELHVTYVKSVNVVLLRDFVRTFRGRSPPAVLDADPAQGIDVIQLNGLDLIHKMNAQTEQQEMSSRSFLSLCAKVGVRLA